MIPFASSLDSRRGEHRVGLPARQAGSGSLQRLW